MATERIAKREVLNIAKEAQARAAACRYLAAAARAREQPDDEALREAAKRLGTAFDRRFSEASRPRT